MTWQALSIAHCIETEPPQLDFVLPGLVVGTVGSIVAPGATGKSWLALEAALLVAVGKDFLGLYFDELRCGKVVILAAEDPAPVLHQRVHALAQHLTSAERAEFANYVSIIPTYGEVGDLLDDGQTARRILEAATGARLVIIDTLSRWHTGDENDRGDASKVMRKLEHIAGQTGAAIVFLHHTNKTAALAGEGDKQQSARGSSVFVDEARWVAFLQTCTVEEAKTFGIEEEMRRHFVRFGVSKANYCPPLEDIWLRREAGGVLMKYDGVMKPQKQQQASKERQTKAKEDDNDWR